MSKIQEEDIVNLLKGFTRAVHHEQPENLILFARSYFNSLDPYAGNTPSHPDQQEEAPKDQLNLNVVDDFIPVEKLKTLALNLESYSSEITQAEIEDVCRKSEIPEIFVPSIQAFWQRQDDGLSSNGLVLFACSTCKDGLLKFEDTLKTVFEVFGEETPAGILVIPAQSFIPMFADISIIYKLDDMTSDRIVQHLLNLVAFSDETNIDYQTLMEFIQEN